MVISKTTDHDTKYNYVEKRAAIKWFVSEKGVPAYTICSAWQAGEICHRPANLKPEIFFEGSKEFAEAVSLQNY